MSRVPITEDAAYWRQMYEERVALQEEGFTALLAERDRYREALRRIANAESGTWGWIAHDALRGKAA